MISRSKKTNQEFAASHPPTRTPTTVACAANLRNTFDMCTRCSGALALATRGPSTRCPAPALSNGHGPETSIIPVGRRSSSAIVQYTQPDGCFGVRWRRRHWRSRAISGASRDRAGFLISDTAELETTVSTSRPTRTPRSARPAGCHVPHPSRCPHGHLPGQARVNFDFTPRVRRHLRRDDK